MNSLILADYSSRKFSLKILEFVCIGLGDLRCRDACPLGKYQCNIINCERSRKSVIIGLDLILELGESLVELFFLFLKGLCRLEILLFHSSLLLGDDILDLLLKFILCLGISIVDPLCCSCLVHKVDRLIRKESV